MSSSSPCIAIVGSTHLAALELSYLRAYQNIGYDAHIFDIRNAISKHTPLGIVGNKIFTHFTVHSWKQKANKDFIVEMMRLKPTVIIVFANAHVLFGALAYLKSRLHCKIVLYWPDALLNMRDYVLDAAPVYDMVASYSETDVNSFRELGFRDAFALPFAGDQYVYDCSPLRNSFVYDISFLGAWRPERERILGQIIANFPSINITIKGTNWSKNTQNKALKPFVSPNPVYGREFAEALNSTRINLNIIDDTNFPAANMRFFEIPIAGGLQLCSQCSEQEYTWIHKQHILYFKNEDELLENVEYALSSPAEMQTIRENAYEFTKQAHTYTSRAESLLATIL